jgi:N-acetylglucosaminyldiphosphoundecaprenol N-acetyl-beta-D-mannosaminyltransferase
MFVLAKIRKQAVLGVDVSATTYQEVADQCASWIIDRSANDPSHYVCVTSVQGVMEARKDPGLRSIFNGADIATPDGMPLVWALRSFGVGNQQRVYGPTLMLVLCEQAARLEHRVFLYGGIPETLGALQSNLIGRFPELKIVGSYPPPFRDLSEEEQHAVQRRIADAKPDLLFVGISTPKQERWMAAHRDLLRGTVMVGVGAAFDFHAGRIQQAPAWMQRHGLEWFYRLTREPGRLWRRYLLVTPWFLPLWAMQKARMTMRHIVGGASATTTSET